ncbi:hypothetical protein Micbo1qcDRAFT_175087 [Microdochium bolleyi]|uniref:DNA2/NAM7 helicase helicase domain-containing protein n=1 Tax=Microdochium bolleyi TaxID=196109 RepID=A0A136J4T4_9PEZI|nr:hypothetical protein Micbo1qcDRAFT_175087 [Microdochium bolleyi]
MTVVKVMSQATVIVMSPEVNAGARSRESFTTLTASTVYSLVKEVACNIDQICRHGKPDTKTLWILPHNDGVDGVAAKTVKCAQFLGTPEKDLPKVLRVYSLVKEVKAGARRLGSDKKQSVDADVAKPTHDEDDEGFTALEHLLVSTVLASWQESHLVREWPKKNFPVSSLHAELATQVLGPVIAGEPRYVSRCRDLLKTFNDKGKVEEWELDSAKDIVKQATLEMLSEAEIVATTAYVAPETAFRRAFKPTIVIQDENSRSREATTTMMLSSFPTALLLLFVGDPRQLLLYVGSTRAKYEKSFNTAFAPQLELSLGPLLSSGSQTSAQIGNTGRWRRRCLACLPV